MTGLIFQHLPGEGAGVLAGVLNELGIQVQTEKLYRGSALPKLHDYDFMLVLGGYQQVWEMDEYPWLALEIQAIHDWVDVQQKPYFGVCLGHQLLAAALGGAVARSATYELGFPPVETLPAAVGDPLFSSIPGITHWLQWHEAEVVQIPAGFTVMAQSENCAIQAMSRGNQVVSLQYHAEGNWQLVDHWTTHPDIACDMAKLGGPEAVARVRSEAEQHLGAAQTHGTRLFKRWLSVNGLVASPYNADEAP